MDRREWMVGMTAMAMGLGDLGGGAQAQTGDDTVYELRVYHLNEGKLPLILDRFRTEERALFERHGMHPVAYWVPTDEPIAGRTLIYLLRHRSRAAADESWAKFGSDPDWIALKTRTEKDGAFVNKHDITFMKLTDFSPKI